MADYSFAFHLMILLLFMLTVLPSSEAIGGSRSRSLNELDTLIRSPVEIDEENGTRWAVLVAGSMGYENYRHQADVCHAYQILKKGGLKDENIVVFMFDDIAMNELNPRPGVIINHPQGTNVYAGVPKDYTGEQVTAENLYAVILGDKSSVKGGSGKVVDSKPNDRIFIYISDHGSTGVLNMPNSTMVYANDFINVLKKKHEDRTYKEMVIYLEACDSGSIFEGTLSEDLNIYVTTASGVYESSYATYCPWTHPPAPREYTACIGDLFSVAWMEDSETNNLKKETIEQQYSKVKERTLNLNSSDDDGSSHVMEYGSKRIKKEMVYLYQGFDPDSKNFLANEAHSNSQMDAIDQRDVDLLFLWQRFKTSTEGSEKKAEILKQIREMMAHRAHLDDSINIIGKLLFEHRKASAILSSTRDQGLPIVDDWDCLKAMVRLFETHCGSLSRHGKKHMRAFANICNNGVTRPAMENACMTACGGKSLEQWIRAYI